MRILITGGSGYIGRFVTDALRAQHEVVVFDLVEAELPVEHVTGDLRIYEDVEGACGGVDAIVHAGAIPYDSGEAHRIMEINVMGTFNVLEAASRHGIPKVVFASSLSAVGLGPFSKAPLRPDYFPFDEKQTCLPDDTYGLSKLIGEQLCAAYARRHGMSAVCLRLAMVYDASRPATVQRLNKIATDPEYGKLFLWAYTDARDVAQAFVLALEQETAKHVVYNIGATDAVAEQPSLELIMRCYPGVPITDENLFSMDPCRSPVDISKAQRELGYEPHYSWR
jgi:UDP-glucose 4-epimerase